MKTKWFLILKYSELQYKLGNELTSKDFENSIVAGPFDTEEEAEKYEMDKLYIDPCILDEMK